ncbi:MAG: hypothetical protein JWR80_314 [Bradyrhizobium sp.]|nr:hypothetical protein [Bradyrhizobium sp.]
MGRMRRVAPAIRKTTGLVLFWTLIVVEEISALLRRPQDLH